MSERDARSAVKRVKQDAAEKFAAEEAAEGRIMKDHGNSFRQIEEHLERGDAAETKAEGLKEEVKEERRHKRHLEGELRVARADLNDGLLREALGAEQFSLLEVRTAQAEERVRSLESEAKTKSAQFLQLEERLCTSESALGDSQTLAGENKEKFKLLEARANLAATVCRERSFDQVVSRFAYDLVRMVTAEQMKGPPSFKSIIGYSHKDFKKGHEEVIKDQQTLDSLSEPRRSFLEYIDAALRRAITLLPRTRMTLFTAAEDMRVIDKSVSSALVGLLSYLDPHLIFTVSYAGVFGVLAQSGSPAAANLVNDAICGGCTARTILNHIYALYEKTKGMSYEFPVTANLLLSFDNLGGKGGYQPKSSRAGLAYSQNPCIFTTLLATTYSPRPPVSSGSSSSSSSAPAKSIQYREELNPTTWRGPEKFDQSLLLFGSDAALELADDKTPEIEKLHFEAVGSLAWLLEQKVFFNSDSLVHLLQRDQFVVALAPESAEGEEFKDCSLCFLRNPKNLGKCGRCGETLPTMKAIRLASKLTHGKGLRVFTPHRPRKVQNVYYVDPRSNRVVAHEMQVRSADDDEEINPLAAIPPVSAQHHKTCLPSLFVNPAGVANIEKVYKRLCEVAKVCGHTDISVKMNDRRAWTFISSDVGGSSWKLLDEKFFRLVHVMGYFHEGMMWTKVTMSILFGVGCGDLAAIHGWKSPRAQKMLRECGDLHKANEFIRSVCKPALGLALLEGFLKRSDRGEGSASAEAASDAQEVDVVDMLKWAESGLAQGNLDQKFANFAYVLLRILPAFELIKKGIATGDYETFSSGRKFFLPYAFALGHVSYGVAIVRDIERIDAMPPEVKAAFIEIFEAHKQGADGDHEEYNRTYKRNILSNSEKGIQSARILTEMAGTVKGWQVNLSATKVSVEGEKRKSRTSTDHVIDVQRCAECLIARGTFEKAAPGIPTVASRINGTPLEAGMSLPKLEEYGSGLLRVWAQKFFSRPKFGKIPPMSRGKSFLPRKLGNAIIAAGDECGEGAAGEEVQTDDQGAEEAVEIDNEDE